MPLEFVTMKRTLITNFISLSTVHIASYILPLIVLPYLVRVIGVEKFGLITFAQALVFYFMVLTVFGFDLHMPKVISIAQDNLQQLKKLFWSAFYARVCLCLLSFIIYLFLILSVERFRQEYLVFLFSFGFIIGDILFSLWFFQGMQRMAYIAILNFVSKLSYTISIFIFIKKESDYILVPIMFSFCQISTGLFAMFVTIAIFKLRPVQIDILEIIKMFKETSFIFISNMSMSVYLRAPVLCLGFFAGNASVAFYSAAEKIYGAIGGIQQNLSRVLFPHVSSLAVNFNTGEAIKFIRKAALFIICLTALISIICFLLAKQIILIIYGLEFSESVAILQILSFLFVIIGFSDIFGIQTMLPLNMTKEYSTSILIGGIINVLLNVMMIPPFRHLGAAISLLITQIAIAAIMYVFIKRQGLNLFDNLHIVGLADKIARFYKNVFT